MVSLKELRKPRYTSKEFGFMVFILWPTLAGVLGFILVAMGS